MPTPSTEAIPEPRSSLLDSLIHRSAYTSCPPEENRLNMDSSEHFPHLSSLEHLTHNTRPTPRQLDTNTNNNAQIARASSSSPSSGASTSNTALDNRSDGGDSETSSQDTAVSPAPTHIDTNNDESKMLTVGSPLDESGRPLSSSSPCLASSPLSTLPLLPSTPDSGAARPIPKYTSSFLRPGSKFTGTQQSDRQVYNVQVEIKHVDMSESFICGYLRIEGLTPDHPTLTTYFEGEIIGTKYSFQTRRAEWGSNEKVDMQHWNRFPAWRPLAKDARRSGFSYKNFAERENVFMRWKEYFLVPDHRVRTISGASFEGFYYICFNQVSGTVSGIYFHAKSEKFQQLELKHVDDRGCMGAMEFR